MSLTETPLAPVTTHAALEDELTTYRLMVEEVAAKRDARVIVNRSEAHAAVVIEHLIRTAHSLVNILTGELHPEVYASAGVVAAARSYMEANPFAKFRVLSERRIVRPHKLLDSLEPFKGRFVQRLLPQDLAAGTPFHFLVADGTSYRFEADKSTFEAFAQFGQSVTGKDLNQAFKGLWKQSSKQ